MDYSYSQLLLFFFMKKQSLYSLYSNDINHLYSTYATNIIHFFNLEKISVLYSQDYLSFSLVFFLYFYAHMKERKYWSGPWGM